MSRARVVFDCMIFLQAAARPQGPAAACFDLMRAGDITLFISPNVLAEVAEVLDRPRLRRKFPSLTAEAVRAFLDEIRAHAILISDVPDSFRLPRDPKDEPYINLAIAAGATYLVSRDNDLIDLMADPDFLRRYPDLAILDPASFLRVVERPH